MISSASGFRPPPTALEPVERIGPVALLALEPQADRTQRLGARVHHAELAVDALLDQAGTLQHLQVARDRRR
jgi:hypothetical protein